MGIQAVVKTENPKRVESVFDEFFGEIEFFPLENGFFGLSIPTKVVNTLGERAVFGKLATLDHYELWSGSWRKPKSKWRLW
ncbi:hypothetical protein [Gilvimarinus agarilyticus]|uniref:hypothetical protein n=1 Tax=Gilvimarinus agarilyticus TaxID=679259 RepID=UPI00059FEF3C|nr:hypothetical protein [Gilvimarinus agarilyticus]